MQNVNVKLNQDFQGTSSIQQEEEFLHQQIGLNLRKELVECYT